ncbi:MAG: anthranilate phosphoribosyltransferase, partial [Actinomycetes bacterium]
GPLANPARPRHQAMGVSDARMADVAAHVLAGRGSSALVFRGEDGLDELSIAGPSRVWVVHDGTVAETVLDPRDVGLSLAPTAALRGGDAAQNAAVMHRVLDGQPGPVRDAVLLNAAAGLVAMDLPTDGLDHGFRDALVRVAEAVDSGAARATLASWVRVSTELSRP